GDLFRPGVRPKITHQTSSVDFRRFGFWPWDEHWFGHAVVPPAAVLRRSHGLNPHAAPRLEFVAIGTPVRVVAYSAAKCFCGASPGHAALRASFSACHFSICLAIMA